MAESLPRLLRLEGQQSFVLDYEHCPVRFSLAPGSSDIVEEFMTGIPPMGESDVKCTRWFHLYGDGIAHSVDGDFLAILLLDHERCLRDREDCPRTCVYRMEFHGNEAAAPGPGSKRTRDGKTCRKRTMEFVHIPLLYESLKAAFRQCAGTGRLRNSHEPHYMEMLSCLIGLTGTDFSRNLPLLGVRKIWDMLSDKDVWPGVLHAFNVGSRSLDVEDCCNRLIARMYYEAYRKHISGVEVSLASVLHAISHAPKLSERTKKLMPAHGRVSTTVRNVNWLLLYWRCAQAPRDGATGDWLHEEACPDPVCEVRTAPPPAPRRAPTRGRPMTFCGQDYGFKAAPSRKNAVAWLDS